MVMALPFWIAMATECSTSVAASSRDRETGARCSAADQVEQGEGVGAESSARLDHEGQELSVVAAGDGCILLAFPAFCGLGSGGRVCWMLTAVGG